MKAKVKLKRRKKFTNKKTATKARRLIMPVLKTGADLRKSVVATWSREDKPKFKPFFELDGTVLRWGIKIDAPDAEDASISVWRLLNDGTKKRYAVMTPGFERKTSVGQFSSSAGVGGFSYLGTMPLPGIEKGQWDEKANEQIEPDIIKAINGIFRS